MEFVEERSSEGAAELLEAAMSQFEVGMSPLKRVIAIGAGQESSGVLVELIALEVRERESVLLWRTQTREERLLGPAEIDVSGDVGTRYEVLPANWSGGGRESRGETRIAPSPPDSASSLAIEVRSFGRHFWPAPAPVSPRMDEVEGLWRFVIALDQGAGSSGNAVG
jgi:hypothetical protein